MLYEMLLGRVPYEGASTGEVLMKHLTAQPEVDALPQPFGSVIRRALAKDPADRYPTVHEMAEELLCVDSVKDSLVGFDAVSLTDAVARVMPRHSPAAPTVGVAPQAPGPPPPPPLPRRAGASPHAQPAAGVSGALRQFADAAGDALKAAAAGVPVGTPRGQSPALSPEAASGHVRYAGFWIRTLAACIDITIVGLISAMLGMNQAGPGIIILYQAILIGAWNGQTIGKKACGIKVIGVDGTPCTLGQSLGRALAKLINLCTLLIGYFMIAFDRQKRGLHDHIAGTLHVYAIE
jgi:uncharacterized RDD family membrane protein YckC